MGNGRMRSSTPLLLILLPNTLFVSKLRQKNRSGKVIDGESFVAEVNGPEKIDRVEIIPKDGKLLIEFDTFITSGDFVVSIKHNGEHIERSPFTVTLSKPDEESERSKSDDIPSIEQEDDSRTIQFKVEGKMANGSTVNAHELKVSIESGPDTAWEPRVVDDDGQLLVSFKTRTLGNYAVSVQKGNDHILGSPFNLQM